jgi:heat shock protein HspQ
MGRIRRALAGVGDRFLLPGLRATAPRPRCPIFAVKEGGSVVQDRNAKFSIGDVVRHRLYPFRGVIFDVDPEFANSEEWWLSIPEAIRPIKEQPYYHLLAENEEATYEAYVSEQNLLTDDSGVPCRHPLVNEYFESRDGHYVQRSRAAN